MDYETVSRIGVKVTMCRNICKVKLPDREHVSSGVTVVDTIKGGDILHDLSVIEKQFQTVNGRRVKVNKLRRNTVYTLMETVNKEGKAIIIPKGKNITIGNKMYDSNYVIVAIDGMVSVISKQMFRKMFVISESSEKLKSRLNIRGNNRKVVKKQRPVDGVNNGTSVQEKAADVFREYLGGTGGNNSKSSNSVACTKNNSSNTKRLKLVARIVDISDKVIGYAAMDDIGNKYKLSYNKVIALAGSGCIDNAKIEIANGKKILKGYAINLNNLPKVYK